jgi:hypothetical protein
MPRFPKRREDLDAGQEAVPPYAPSSELADWITKNDPTQKQENLGLAKLHTAIVAAQSQTGSAQNVTWLTVGDSLAARGQAKLLGYVAGSIETQTSARSMSGSAGIVVGATSQGIAAALDGAATLTETDYQYLISGRYWTLAAATDAVRFYNGSSQLNRADTIVVYYLKTSGAGTFKVQTSTTAINSGFADETGFTAIAADNGGADTLGIARISVTAGNYAVRAEWVSGGDVVILGVAWENTSVPALDLPAFNVGGQSAGTAAAGVNDQMMSDYLEDSDPDVISFMWDDVATEIDIFADALDGWITTSGITRPTVVAFGCNPKDGLDAAMLATNEALEAKSAKYGWFFVNGFLAGNSSWAALDALGIGGDGTHMHDTYYHLLSLIAVHKLGIADYKTRAKYVRNWDSIASDPGVDVRRMFINRLSASTPALEIYTDNTFGLDAHATMERALHFRKKSDNSVVWQFSANTAVFKNRMPTGVEITSGGPTINAGSGSPEGALTAPVGSTYQRTDGSAGTSFYVKESGTGNTGWTAK